MQKHYFELGTLSPFNHVRLITRVYPKSPTDKSSPRPNKLATLLFYASTKPAKLIKVGKYLLGKVQVDIFWKRRGHNKITIDILDGILTSCSQYLEFFVNDFLQMVSYLLDDDDATIVSNITATFVKFCELFQAYAIDGEFYQKLNPVVEKYAELCKYKSSEDLIHRYEFRLAGLKGIQAAATLENFIGHGTDRRLYNIWSGIASNILLEDPLRMPSGTDRIVPHANLVKPTFVGGDMVFESLAFIATYCMQTIVSRSTSTTIESLIKPLFAALKECNDGNHIGKQLFEKMSETVQSRHCYLVACETVKELIEQKEIEDRNQHPMDILEIIPKFSQSETFMSFPIVNFLEPMVDKLNEKEVSEVEITESMKKVLGLIDIIASGPNFVHQARDAVVFFIGKIVTAEKKRTIMLLSLKHILSYNNKSSTRIFIEPELICALLRKGKEFNSVQSKSTLIIMKQILECGEASIFRGSKLQEMGESFAQFLESCVQKEHFGKKDLSFLSLILNMPFPKELCLSLVTAAAKCLERPLKLEIVMVLIDFLYQTAKKNSLTNSMNIAEAARTKLRSEHADAAENFVTDTDYSNDAYIMEQIVDLKQSIVTNGGDIRNTFEKELSNSAASKSANINSQKAPTTDSGIFTALDISMKENFVKSNALGSNSGVMNTSMVEFKKSLFISEDENTKPFTPIFDANFSTALHKNALEKKRLKEIEALLN